MNDDLTKYREAHEQFNCEFEKQNEIIRRYDEVINEKAGKMALKVLDKEVKDTLRTNKVEVLLDMKKIKEQVELDLDTVNDFIRNIEHEVTRIIDDYKVKENIRNGGGAANDILATDAGRNLKKQLVMKADKIDIEKLYEIKSNKEETETMISC